jgi:hypothetical protein
MMSAGGKPTRLRLHPLKSMPINTCVVRRASCKLLVERADGAARCVSEERRRLLVIKRQRRFCVAPT